MSSGAHTDPTRHFVRPVWIGAGGAYTYCTANFLVGGPPSTPTTTFETFPFPWPLDTPDEALSEEQLGHRDAIGEAAGALDEARRHWLNPPELVREEPDVLPSLPPRLLPVDEDAAKQLAKRTLTNLYNARPAWLAHLHAALDAGGAGGGRAAGAVAGGESGAGGLTAPRLQGKGSMLHSC